MGSDWSVSTPDPMQEMYVAVNRRMPEDYAHRVQTRETFLPDERIDLATAIAGFTSASAYVNHLDADTGSIEVGKLADLVVVDRNLFEHPLERLADASVVATYVGGALVYARDA
jgi:hypothetical protein